MTHKLIVDYHNLASFVGLREYLFVHVHEFNKLRDLIARFVCIEAIRNLTLPENLNVLTEQIDLVKIQFSCCQLNEITRQ